MSTVSASDVKALRDRTGAGMMDCKAALAEAQGDLDRAIEILRVRGQASAAKRSGRTTSEGVVASYIHATGKVGALVEVQCETDFVARNDEFRDFAREVALHVAGAPTPPLYVTTDEIPDADREAERSVHEQKAREGGKPDEVIDKIVSGQLGKWEREIALLDQEHINSDRYDGKTIGDLRTEIAARTGENVRIARFARFAVGEE
ncbi:MAG TPA: translation elongation factor Ts [Solirubrobacterales bacterium]|nr:translation elongation factor Ts [Solirubrobacterales bacterium]